MTREASRRKNDGKPPVRTALRDGRVLPVPAATSRDDGVHPAPGFRDTGGLIPETQTLTNAS